MATAQSSNGHARHQLKAPDGGLRIRGKFYRAGQLVPSRYRRLVEGVQADPAIGQPLTPPNFGRTVLPHAITFIGKQSTVAHVYRNPDEAVLRSGGQAWKMRRDPAIMECLEARQRGTALLNWHLEVEDEKDPAQIKLKDELTKIVKRTYQFTEYRRCLLEALWYGRYAVQHKFGFEKIDGQLRTVIKGWQPVNGDKLIFRFDDGSGRYRDDEVGIRVTPIYGQKDVIAGGRVLEVTDVGMCYFLEPWERSLLAIHRHIIEDGDYEDPISAGRIHGVGIRDRIYWCWYQKQETLAQLMEVIDRTGSGITIYWYPAGNKEAEEATIALAEKQKHENVLVMPRMSGDPAQDAYGIERIEPTSSGIDSMVRVIDEFFGDQMMRYICGGTLFSKSKSLGIGGGGADIQEQSFYTIVQYDSVKLEESISTEMVLPLKAFNFPWARDIPVFFRIDTDSPDSQEKLQAAKTAFDMGAKILTKDVMSKVGMSIPKEGDDYLQNPQFAQQPGMPGQPGAMGGGQPGDLHDLFGPLADELGGGQPGGDGGQPPPGGAAGGGGEPPPNPSEGGGPAKYAKRQIKSTEGQQALPGLGDDNSRSNYLWKESLHPRAPAGSGHGGEFAHKAGASAPARAAGATVKKPLPAQHGQSMLFSELASKLHETEQYPDSKTAKAQQADLFKTLAQSDVHPDQLHALLSGDEGRMQQVQEHALATGQHEPPADAGDFAEQAAAGIGRQLEAMQPVRDAIKARAMLYQPDLKEEAAKANGVPFDTYYHLPHDEWDKIRSEYLAKERAARSAQISVPPPSESPSAGPAPLAGAAGSSEGGLKSKVQGAYKGPESVVSGERQAGFTDKPQEAAKAKSLGLHVEPAGQFQVYGHSPEAVSALKSHLQQFGYGTTPEQKQQLSRLAGYSDSEIKDFAKQQGEPFSLQRQKEKIGMGLGAGDKTPNTGGHQAAFWHGMEDAPGQGKMFEGMDLAGKTAEPGAAFGEQDIESSGSPPMSAEQEGTESIRGMPFESRDQAQAVARRLEEIGKKHGISGEELWRSVMGEPEGGSSWPLYELSEDEAAAKADIDRHRPGREAGRQQTAAAVAGKSSKPSVAGSPPAAPIDDDPQQAAEDAGNSRSLLLTTAEDRLQSPATKEAGEYQSPAKSNQAVKEPGMSGTIVADKPTFESILRQSKEQGLKRKQVRDLLYKANDPALWDRRDEMMDALGFDHTNVAATKQQEEAEARKAQQQAEFKKQETARLAAVKQREEKQRAADEFKQAKRKAEIDLQKNVTPHWPTWHRANDILDRVADYFDAVKHHDVKDAKFLERSLDQMQSLFDESGLDTDSSAADIWQSVVKFRSVSPRQKKALATAVAKAAAMSGVGKGDKIGESPALHENQQAKSVEPLVKKDESAKIDTAPAHYVSLIASKKTSDKPYLAKIGSGFSRDFVKGRKYTNSSKVFGADMGVGEVLEWRGANWDRDEGSYVGGKAHGVLLHDGLAIVSPNTARRIVELKGQGWQPFDHDDSTGDLLLRRDGEVMQLPQQGESGTVSRRSGNDFAEVGGVRISAVAPRPSEGEADDDE